MSYESLTTPKGERRRHWCCPYRGPVATEELASPIEGAKPPSGVRAVSLTDVGSLVFAAFLVALAIFIGKRMDRAGHFVYANAAPLQGYWQRHSGPGTWPAIAVGLLAVLLAPWACRRLRWITLLGISAVASIGWTVCLAWVDGWHRGFADRLTAPDQYLAEIHRVHGLHAFLSGFVRHIASKDPSQWDTHVAGHPPGALLIFVGLNRIGLGGGTWAGLLCVGGGALGIVSVLVTIARCTDQAMARALAPYLVFWPAALFVGVSADGLFLGVSAAGIALLAVGCVRRGRVGSTLLVGSGVLLGLSLYLSYGLLLLAPIVLVVFLRVGKRRDLGWLAIGGAVFPLLFTIGGFSWWGGYRALHARYYDGIGGFRPYHYWAWADFAALLCAIGPAALPAFSRAIRGLTAAVRASRRRLDHQAFAAAVSLAAIVALVSADLSGLSKAEVERIWLPFMPWVLAASVLLPARSARGWLALQVTCALVLQHSLLSLW